MDNLTDDSGIITLEMLEERDREIERLVRDAESEIASLRLENARLTKALANLRRDILLAGRW